MSRPYPNRDRARHQLGRGHASRIRHGRSETSPVGTLAYLESDEFREFMQRMGDQFSFARWSEALAALRKAGRSPWMI